MFKLLVILGLVTIASSQNFFFPQYRLNFGNSTSSGSSSPPSTSSSGSSSSSPPSSTSSSGSSSGSSSSSGSNSSSSTSTGGSSSSGSSSSNPPSTSSSGSGSGSGSVSGSDFYNMSDFYLVNKFTYSSCGTSTDLAQNLVLSVVPELPQTDFKLFLEADLLKSVTSGTSTYAVTLNGYPYRSTADLCDELQNSTTHCPLTMGYLKSESTGAIPSGVVGRVVIKNEWFDSDHLRILCMKYDMTIA